VYDVENYGVFGGWGIAGFSASIINVMKYFFMIGVLFAGAFFALNHQELAEIQTSSPKKEIVVVAVGDTMLGRFVEELSLRHGFDYPFASTSDIFSGADIVFANFEGAIPKVHEKTPNYNYKLSVPQESVMVTHRAGINVVSLSNNHSGDFGAEGYANTVSVLNNAGIATVGKYSDYVYEQNDMKIRFMGWNDTFTHFATSTFSKSIRSSKKDGEFLIASVHFGEEYATTSNARQKSVAHTLIDAGADVVIGTHPHVVEEMEIYHGKPIFYSLGNFIFDQYFSEETQKGLAVKMIIKEGAVEYEMLPIDLAKSQPKLNANVAVRKFTVFRQ